LAISAVIRTKPPRLLALKLVVMAALLKA